MTVDLVLLDESQNQAFDTDYHNPKEMADKLRLIAGRFADLPFSILDLGGGNGLFLDRLLDRFPHAKGTLLDVSPALLAQNQPHPRKRLIEGSVNHLPDETFDLITINWLLHHLVGQTYEQSHRNVIAVLRQCRDLLTPRGVIVVTENMFDGVFYSNLPSRLIYTITRVKTPWFAKLARRAFNTAGVGVCFNSRRAWRRLFRDSGLILSNEHPGIVWHKPVLETLAMRCLGLTQVSTHHFYLINPLFSTPRQPVP